jgi:hypothetical protein
MLTHWVAGRRLLPNLPTTLICLGLGRAEDREPFVFLA